MIAPFLGVGSWKLVDSLEAEGRGWSEKYLSLWVDGGGLECVLVGVDCNEGGGVDRLDLVAVWGKVSLTRSQKAPGPRRSLHFLWVLLEEYLKASLKGVGN